MTTIAADSRAGVMCADSIWSDGTEKASFKKVFRVRRALVGLAGTITEIERWVADYKAGVDIAGRKYDIQAIRLTTAGIDRWSSGDDWFHIAEPQYAIGSGGLAARAAMMAGADCKRAVQIATQIDASSGGAVRCYRLTA